MYTPPPDGFHVELEGAALECLLNFRYCTGMWFTRLSSLELSYITISPSWCPFGG